MRQDLNLGRANDALQALDVLLAQNPADAEAHNLRCRVYYEEVLYDRAVADCEAAVNLEPGNSNYHLWLGRAYGQKAMQVSLVSAYKLAHKVAAQFQIAVQLDPKNTEALEDLGEFDVSAPAVAGGGSNHAEPLVQRLQPLDPAGALVLQARIEESKRRYDQAEADLKAAIAQCPRPASAWMDLAAFYQRRGRIDDMVAAVHTAASLDRAHGPALVEAAGDLVRAGRESQTAIRWLREYLDSHAQSEDAPAFAVRARLAQLLANQGDLQGAQREVAAVHALAPGYRIPNPNASARIGQ